MKAELPDALVPAVLKLLLSGLNRNTINGEISRKAPHHADGAWVGPAGQGWQGRPLVGSSSALAAAPLGSARKTLGAG